MRPKNATDPEDPEVKDALSALQRGRTTPSPDIQTDQVTNGPPGEQTQTLARLEQVAQECAASKEAHEQPREARKGEGERRWPPKWWFVPYLIGLAILGVALLILDWSPTLFGPSTSIKLRRYLLGAIGITVVLGLTPAVDLYGVGR